MAKRKFSVHQKALRKLARKLARRGYFPPREKHDAEYRRSWRRMLDPYLSSAARDLLHAEMMFGPGQEERIRRAEAALRLAERQKGGRIKAERQAVERDFDSRKATIDRLAADLSKDGEPRHRINKLISQKYPDVSPDRVRKIRKQKK